MTTNYGAFRNLYNHEGVMIDLSYSGFEAMPNAHWEQTIISNIPGIGSDMKYNFITGRMSYNDDSQSGIYKWYYSRAEMNKHINNGGWSINFVDAPRRSIPFGNSSAYWSAQLYLINNGNPVLRISYGFTLDFLTGLHPFPLSYYIYPQYKK